MNNLCDNVAWVWAGVAVGSCFKSFLGTGEIQMANGKNILTFASFTCALCVFLLRDTAERWGRWEGSQRLREDFSNVQVMQTRTLNPNTNQKQQQHQHQQQKCTMHLKLGGWEVDRSVYSTFTVPSFIPSCHSVY